MNDDSEIERRPLRGAKVSESVRTNMRRIHEFDDALEARIPGARRWIKCYKPYTDASGVWHAGPVLRDTRAPLTVQEALERLNAQARRNA